MKKAFSRIYLFLIFGILYIPIVTLIFFSFNSSNSTAVFTGFSFYWYRELFGSSSDAFDALKNTLILAISSAVLSTVIGTAASEGIYRMKSKLFKKTVTSVTNIPMMNPDIVTGMSMMLFFVALVGVLRLDYDAFGFWAMLIAHTTFSLPYVILSVLPRVEELGKKYSEAALDLGATPLQAFFLADLPNLLPGVITGFIMAFTLSLDDFVISYFVGSSSFQTLPLLIYSMTKKKVKPDMYALSTLIIITIFLILLLTNVRNGRLARKKGEKK